MSDSLLEVRRLFTTIDEMRVDVGQPLARPKRTVIAGAVITNPYAGRFEPDLSEWTDAACAPLGELLSEQLVAVMAHGAEAYGKAAIVGLAGDVEVGSAVIHHLSFGNPLRGAVGGTTLLPAVEKVAAAGAPFDIPLKHLLDDRTRSHHQTVTVHLADCPRPDEIVIALAITDAGRPFARIGEFRPAEATDR